MNTPDYEIRALRKGSKDKATIGFGWLNPDGSIKLWFNPFVVVPVGEQYVITAFKWRPEKAATATVPEIQDEIPF